ncbi:Uncharacterised protein at_DN2558 [Pycnogonum litorale]
MLGLSADEMDEAVHHVTHSTPGRDLHRQHLQQLVCSYLDYQQTSVISHLQFLEFVHFECDHCHECSCFTQSPVQTGKCSVVWQTPTWETFLVQPHSMSRVTMSSTIHQVHISHS